MTFINFIAVIGGLIAAFVAVVLFFFVFTAIREVERIDL